GQVLADEIEPEDVEHQRQEHEDKERNQRKADEFEIAVAGDRGRHGSYLLTLRTKRPCGRSISRPITKRSVSTLAMEPEMKNSSVDCDWEIVNAEAMVPSRLCAPPKTTTRNVSTM